MKKVLKCLPLHGLLIVLLSCCSCNTSSRSTTPVSRVVTTTPVNVDTANQNVTSAKGYNIQATKKVEDAQDVVMQVKQSSIEADAIIEDMRKTESPYTVDLVNLKQKYEAHISILETRLKETREILKRQLSALSAATSQLVRAREQSIASENEKKILRANNDALNTTLTEVEKDLEKAEEYRDKYHKLTKYRWIVWGLGIWILLKFLGALGAWSPQGRIARALIG